MKDLTKILKSFQLRKNLNPKIWKNGGESMNPQVRERLLEIANNFIEELNVDTIISDVIMTGSLSNYNWSNFSDVDLHIVMDFNQFTEKELPLYEELFKLKKTLYNQKHDITIYGYDVELYAQNEEETHFSSGVYSVLNNEWINKPKKEKIQIDVELIKNKIHQWMDIIDNVIENAKDEDLEEAKLLISKYKDKIKKYRTCGLEKDGEFSDENLVFKGLRRNGYIEKLFSFENQLIDKKFTLNELLIDSDKVSYDKSDEKTIELKNETLSSDKDIKNKIVNTIKDLLKKNNSISDINVKKIKSNLIDVFNGKNKILNQFYELLKSNKELKNLTGIENPIPVDKSVELLQTGLQFLGFLLPKWGIDGRFGNETEDAVKKFKKKYGLGTDGIMLNNDLISLFSILIIKGFDDFNMSNVEKEKDLNLIFPSTSGDNFKQVTKKVINKIEGGYYNPDWHYNSAMGRSGETMFGIDRKHGGKLNTSPPGVEFWNIIDKYKTKDVWKHGYRGGNLEEKLIDLVVKIIQPYYEELSQRYLTPESIKIINTNEPLLFHFIYAAWNGAGFFKKFASDINREVKRGNINKDELKDIAINSRKNSGVSGSANKISKIFDEMT
jgi:peptidoglycan hydrolase-like protein with peptidoglycan-binding domain